MQNTGTAVSILYALEGGEDTHYIVVYIWKFIKQINTSDIKFCKVYVRFLKMELT